MVKMMAETGVLANYQISGTDEMAKRAAATSFQFKAEYLY
jgi:hypothetical protein